MEKKKTRFIKSIHAPQVYVDPGHLRQILINIIENAIHSIEPNGEIRVASKKESLHVQIEIHDNGHGIDESIKDKIFDPFFTTKEKGSGLGLAIVKKLVEENNGDIAISSEEKNGTTFILTFPAQPLT